LCLIRYEKLDRLTEKPVRPLAGLHPRRLASMTRLAGGLRFSPTCVSTLRNIVGTVP